MIAVYARLFALHAYVLSDSCSLLTDVYFQTSPKVNDIADHRIAATVHRMWYMRSQ